MSVFHRQTMAKHYMADTRADIFIRSALLIATTLYRSLHVNVKPQLHYLHLFRFASDL